MLKIAVRQAVKSSVLALSLALTSNQAIAQFETTSADPLTNRPLELAADSPFRDPDIIYLEADELINNEPAKLLTAQGEVVGRYQDRTLRADRVIYNLESGAVVATGNVILTDPTGATQSADKIELSNTLTAGNAANFTARQPGGGTLAAAFVTRTEGEEIELYNAYYTPCEICEDAEKNGKAATPSWRIKARKVSQDRDTRTIRYNDAVFELLGVPVFYTPYLAHADPSARRASGILTPFAGYDSATGLFVSLPYYWAIDDYSEATFTPHVFQNVNPLLEYQAARQFNTGRIDVEGSFTYGSQFDRDGDPFDPAEFVNPADAPGGKKLRSHIYAKGFFEPTDFWDYGFGVQLTTDDNYLNRYNLEEDPEDFGLYKAESRRNVSQAFAVAQDDTFRFSVSTFGFQDLRTTFLEDQNTGLITVDSPDDRELPIIAPKIEFEKYITAPQIGGRLKAFGDTTLLTRDIGTDYFRATGGLDYSKTFITDIGVEVKPFANARYDYFSIEPEDPISAADTSLEFDKVEFGRGLGQVGADVRYPFIKQGKNVDLIIEPRLQVTHSFGDAKLDRFTVQDSNNQALTLFQDGINTDFNQSLLWQGQKSTGYDFWQNGSRADIGVSFIADWEKTRADFFVGRSYASGFDDSFAQGSGLEGGRSDYVGRFALAFNSKLQWTTDLRYDADDKDISRIDTSLNYRSRRFTLGSRYYRLDESSAQLIDNPDVPAEAIEGEAILSINRNWSLRYAANRDLDLNVTREQEIGLIFKDDCTLLEIFYERNNFGSDVIRDSDGFGVRLTLLPFAEANR